MIVDTILEKGVCDAYSGKVQRARSKAELAAMLDANACEWLAIKNKDGALCRFVMDEFAPFVNGNFINDNGGYTASVWCGHKGKIELVTDITAIIGHGKTNVRIVVAPHNIKRVFVSGCKVQVSLGDGARLYIDTPDEIEIDNVNVKIRRI